MMSTPPELRVGHHAPKMEISLAHLPHDSADLDVLFNIDGNKTPPLDQFHWREAIPACRIAYRTQELPVFLERRRRFDDPKAKRKQGKLENLLFPIAFMPGGISKMMKTI